jgi:hypothetical protein
MKVTWPQVTLFLGIFVTTTVGACTLVIMGKDVNVILTLAAVIAIPILAAGGAVVQQKLEQVKEVANGNLSRVLDELARTNQNLARVALQAPSINPDILSPNSPTRDAHHANDSTLHV